ncbi:MAG: efflux RND transporter periplasmic adaptor subunit [Gemmatimonadetes bacterium]|nr:efflux RND transporter periplasmic adaptor subunit [Gemmatimonadota bacterium]
MTRLRIGIVVVVVLAVAAVWMLSRRGKGGDRYLVASGTVEATEVDLGFQVAGRVERIDVREGDAVHAGAELAALDRAELEARRAAAEAQVTAVRAQLAELEAGFRPEELSQGRSALAAAAQRLADAARDLERTRVLFEGGAVSREALDNAETVHEIARTQHEQARAQLDILERGPRTERIAGQRALVRQAEAALEQTNTLLQNAVIVAPLAGIVTLRHREPGETVSPGLPVLTLMDPADRWVRIYVREDQVGRVSIGQPAVITADSYPERTYDGHVVFIASEAEFTPRNVQTQEERVRLVYAVKVAIRGDPGRDLKPGLPVDVRLDVGEP